MEEYPNLADQIIILHDNLINKWKDCLSINKSNDLPLTHSSFLSLVEQNHICNFHLWHDEDRARREDMGYEFVYHAKRAIDQYNQQRNNFTEAMDAWLCQELKPSPDINCIIHSETPGMIIDRLSILALKIYHINQQL